MTAPRCKVCGRLIPPIPHEHVSFWRSRQACSEECRNALRSLAQKERQNDRLQRAVRSWTEGVAPSVHAQRHGVKHADFRKACAAAGVQLPSSTPGRKRTARTPPPKRKQSAAPIDRLLLRLVEVYGPARAAVRSAA